MIDAAPAGWVMRLGEETRTEEQNRKLHPMLRDIQRQVPGMETFSLEDMKLRFLNSLGTELRFLPTIEEDGLFPVGLRSSTLSKTQFSALLELVLKYGAEKGVQWSASRDEQAA